MKKIVATLAGTLGIVAVVTANEAASNSAGNLELSKFPQPEMIHIPAGSFKMGSPSGEADQDENEVPQHLVAVRAFELSKTLITRGQFAAFVQETGYIAGNACWVFTDKWIDSNGHWAIRDANWLNPGYAQKDNHPVACVNWNDAQAYVQWLSRKTGKQYRLPTEAEWEYAARAGTTTSNYWGDAPDLACIYGNVADLTAKNQVSGMQSVHNCNDGYAYTSPVAHFKPNAFGLYDMQGNLEQWVADNYHYNYEKAPVDGSEWYGDDPRRVLRGSSWQSFPWLVRAATRLLDDPTVRNNTRGFRIARTLP